jgi:hypothetical protein
MKAIYKLHFDCGRQGELTGIFVADKAKMNGLIQSGAEVYFGEVLGKHSDIAGPIEESDITMVSDDQDFVALFEKHDMATGYNPFDYIEEEAD